RHTRFSRDWSSDVCSSDLVAGLCIAAGISAWRRSLDVLLQAQNWLWTQPLRLRFWLGGALFPAALALLAAWVLGSALASLGAVQIGRASCRGRGEESETPA